MVKSESEDAPVRLNFIRFLAEERRQAVVDMSHGKLKNSNDDMLLKVLNAMIALEDGASLNQLSAGGKGKLLALTAQDILQGHKVGTENQVNDAFALLQQDASQIVQKVGMQG